MTDLNKERELFLNFHYEQYLKENPEVDKENAKYIYDYAHKNMLVEQLRESHFIVWLAAKAQAVPEGYIVVPKEPTREMIKAVIDEAMRSPHLVDFYKVMVKAGALKLASESGAEK
ncbi:hypothetical protein ACT4YA_15425 [Acinetobacter baumannii]